MTDITQKDIKNALNYILSGYQKDLLASSEEDLHKRFHFTWDAKGSAEWNLYQFSSALEHFKKDCRDWESHHNGSLCVVERVRDKYLKPKLREFLASLKANNQKDDSQ